MPAEGEAANAYPPVVLERAEIVDDGLVFAGRGGFDRALAQGFFLIKEPAGLDLADSDRFCRHFHEQLRHDELDVFRGFRSAEVPGDYQGYFDREHDQWENFYIEADNWGLLPLGVTAGGRQMAELGITVLRSVLDHLNVPRRDWDTVTGGLTANRGHQMLAFNHFRSDKAVRGCKFHRDSGWVTILRSTEPGLLALIDGELGSINPEPGYLVANFGSSIEVLTEQLPRRVRANVHGVARTERGGGRPDRWSYVVFLDSELAGTIYRYEGGQVVAVQSVADFAVQEVSRTYDDDDRL